MELERIKGIRLRLGLSQEGLARLLGVSSQTVRRWEIGSTKPLPIISARLEELEEEIGRAQAGGGGPVRGERRGGAGRGPGEASLGGLVKGLGSFFDLVVKMVEEGREEASDRGEVEALGGRLKGIYGFSVRVGLEGKPVIERFGNIRETDAGPVVTETQEPVVDVLDEGAEFVVIVELPGVEEDGIRLEAKGDVLVVSAANRGRRYYKEVLFPSAIDSRTLKSSYRNGILEVRCRKS